MSHSVRGGGNSNGNDDPPKSVADIQEEAIGNIADCYQMAFLAGLVGTASVLWESYQTSHAGWDFTITQKADLMVHGSDFIFGAGLVQAHRLFQQSRDDDRMSPPKMVKLMQILSRLWLGSTALMSIDGVVFASELKLPTKTLVGISALFVLNFPFGEWFHRNTLDKQNPPAVSSNYSTARNIGLTAARNMIWCVGSIAVSGLVDSIELIRQTARAESTEDMVGNVIGGLLDVSESVAIGGLLASLYKTLLRAVLSATKQHFTAKDPSFRDYYQAQSKFYGRLASFFRYQAVFTALGYVAQVGEKLWFHLFA